MKRWSVSIALLLAACSKDASGPPAPPAVASVTVTPDSATVVLFDTLLLQAVARDAGGTQLTGRGVTWSSSVPNTVFVLATGRVQALARGSATITANIEGKTATAKIAVLAPVTGVVVTPDNATLAVGDTLRLHVALVSSDGGPPTDSTVVWTSADTTRATISPTGLVRAKYPGTVVITATAGGKTGHATLGIPVPVASLTVTPRADTLLADSTAQLVAITRDSANNALSGRVITWHSSDTTVVVVSPTGAIVGRGAGDAFVAAKSEGKSDSAGIHVIRSTVATVTLSLDSLSLLTLARRGLTVSVKDSAGNPLNRPVVWSSSDPSKVSVTYAGVVTGVGAGTALVFALAEGKADTAQVTVDTINGRFVAVSAGLSHTCGVTTSAAAYCWGRSDFGAIGDGGVTHSCNQNAPCVESPTAVAGGLSFTQIASGYWHNCGLVAGGTTYCWGDNSSGQLGSSGTETCPSGQLCSSSPHLVTGGIAFTRLAVGQFHSCGLGQDSLAYCWGSNTNFQLGGDSVSQTAHTTPVQVYGGHKFVALALGASHSCALTATGAAYCWGWGYEGELGNDSVANLPASPKIAFSPVAVDGLHTFVQLVAGGYHTCGLTSGGSAYCWGSNGYGMLGDGTVDVSTIPKPVSGGHAFARLSAGYWSTCGATGGNAAYCWGLNDNGQIGTGATANALLPTAVPGGLSVSAIWNGYNHSCGLTTDGFLYCWGNNVVGQLGLGYTTTPIVTPPVRVAGQP